MSLSLLTLKRREIDWMEVHYCQHRMRYTDHRNCYRKDKMGQEKIAVLDLEQTGFNGRYDWIVAYSLREVGGKTYSRSVTHAEVLNKTRDKGLLKDFTRCAVKYDRLITFRGAKHDLPFLRTRCLFWGLDFPIYKSIKHTDIYYIAKFKLRLSYNGLAEVCRLLGISSKLQRVTPELINDAMMGDRKALKFHEEKANEDTESTLKVWERLKEFSPVRDTSI